ncbi:MAG: hypothetical protein HOM07_24320, partial [Rhodospirillaceae bacterium]|nr:hypothetical protein [Rhodospirillaceae bacterium]
QRDAAREFLKFHCGASIIDAPNDAAFAILDGGDVTPALDAFNPGTAEYPDRSTTVIFQMDRLMAGCGHTLRGPGIQDHVNWICRICPLNVYTNGGNFVPNSLWV